MLEDLGRRAQDAAVILAGTSEKTRNDALEAIAKEALKRKSGARGLRAIIEGVMTDTMFELPSLENVRKCIITREAVLGGEKPRLIFGEAQPALPEPQQAIPEPQPVLDEEFTDAPTAG